MDDSQTALRNPLVADVILVVSTQGVVARLVTTSVGELQLPVWIVRDTRSRGGRRNIRRRTVIQRHRESLRRITHIVRGSQVVRMSNVQVRLPFVIGEGSQSVRSTSGSSSISIKCSFSQCLASSLTAYAARLVLRVFKPRRSLTSL